MIDEWDEWYSETHGGTSKEDELNIADELECVEDDYSEISGTEEPPITGGSIIDAIS